MPLPPLPEPGFAVYGLDDGFSGDRWLELWNATKGNDLSLPDNPVCYVRLGHGDASGRDATVVVGTYVHLEGSPGLSRGHAAADAAVRMVEHIWSQDRIADDDMLRAELRRANESAHALDVAPWIERVARIDGEPVAFRFREQGDAWAAAATLDEVAIGVAGWGVDFTEYSLSVVDPTGYRLLGA